MMNTILRTKDYLDLKAKLETSFENLMKSFCTYDDNGICVTDVEFALVEHNALLYELSELNNGFKQKEN